MSILRSAMVWYSPCPAKRVFVSRDVNTAPYEGVLEVARGATECNRNEPFSSLQQEPLAAHAGRHRHDGMWAA